MGTPGVASTPHTLYLLLTATPTSSPRLPDIPSLPSAPSPLLHLFYPKKRLWMFRWMIHGLDRWLMDALSSVRSPYSHLPEERVKSRHFTLGLIIKQEWDGGSSWRSGQFQIQTKHVIASVNINAPNSEGKRWTFAAERSVIQGPLGIIRVQLSGPLFQVGWCDQSFGHCVSEGEDRKLA